MRSVLLFCFAVFSVGISWANTPKAVTYNHVPDKLDPKSRLIHPSAQYHNHVLIVNVNNAIPSDVYPTIVTYTLSRINLNAWTNTLEKSIVKDLIANPQILKNKFSNRAIVAVFIEKNAEGPSFLNAPGHWAMINVRGLDKDGPDKNKLHDRYAKMILKGIGHACGAGASIDQLCALNYDSFTLSGMDKTDIRLSPMTYFPMLSTLRALGGVEITCPVYE